jgi:hypothetical protein
MFRRKLRRNVHPRADELRAVFVANRDRVRSWLDDWYFPEVAWPEFRAIPSPYVVPRDLQEMWFERHAPSMPQYWWLLEPAPLTGSISQVYCCWWFGEGHRFDRLTLNTRTVADPAYLAERLALGVDAAHLPGWQDGDAEDTHRWLLGLLDKRPMDVPVRQTRRCGFVVVAVTRYPYSRTEIDVEVVVTVAATALDGTPLDGTGRPVPR